jgi:hypothetical protein
MRRCVPVRVGVSVKTLVDRGLSGDVKAIASIFNLVARYVSDAPLPDDKQAVDPSDAAIIDDFVRRRIASQILKVEPVSSLKTDLGESQ